MAGSSPRRSSRATRALRDDWPVDGTTGYEFLNLVGGLFVDASAEAAMTATYREFTGLEDDLPAVIRESKLVVLRENLGSELNRLTGLLLEICEGHRRHRDHTRHACHEVLRELAVVFPRYRTYVQADVGMIEPQDAATIAEVVDAAIEANPGLDPDLVEFVGDLLALRIRGPRESELVMRFQQLTGAVMAKGVEDTAFYRYHRLASLNEVGGDPGRFGVTPAAFHAANADRHAGWPDAMLTTSTHDTKRAEDVRARISVLSEMPGEWTAAVRRWSAMLAPYRTGELPDRNAEYLLYQTLVGTWPIEAERLDAYLLKAAREAKVHTSWTAPDEAYEAALAAFAAGAVADEAFIADLEAFVAPRRGRRSRQLDRADAAQADRAGRAGHLPGHGPLGPQPGGSRQPPPGRFRAPPSPPGRHRRSHPGDDPRRDGRGRAQAVDDRTHAGRAAGSPRAVRRGAPATGPCRRPARAPSTSWRSSARATWPSWCPASSTDWADPRGATPAPGRRRAWRCPRAPGGTSSGGRPRQMPAAEIAGGDVPIATLLARFPVALLVRSTEDPA